MNEAAALLAAVEIGDPLTRGSLSLFPLFHERPPAPPYVPGPRSEGRVEVHELAEGATVPELDITNLAALPLLLIDGETLLGAKQNRIVTVSTVIAPKASAPVPVTCVEAGRWGDEQAVGRSARLAPSEVRARNRRHVAMSVDEAGAPMADQGEVWAAIDDYVERFDIESPTRALEDVHAARASFVDGLVAGTRPLRGQCGVAAAIGERVVSVDLFDTPGTLVAYWPSLVAGYALDVDADVVAGSKAAPRRRVVRRLLGSVASCRATAADGRLFLADGDTSATAALLGDSVVHLAVSA